MGAGDREGRSVGRESLKDNDIKMTRMAIFVKRSYPWVASVNVKQEMVETGPIETLVDGGDPGRMRVVSKEGRIEGDLCNWFQFLPEGSLGHTAVQYVDVLLIRGK